jgi:hypothetical protein
MVEQERRCVEVARQVDALVAAVRAFEVAVVRDRMFDVGSPVGDLLRLMGGRPPGSAFARPSGARGRWPGDAAPPMADRLPVRHAATSPARVLPPIYPQVV